MSRNDDLGYIMLHEAIRIGEALGLVGDKAPQITSGQLSPEMDASCRRTAWGLFNIDTYVSCTLFTMIQKVVTDTRKVGTYWLPQALFNIPRQHATARAQRS